MSAAAIPIYRGMDFYAPTFKVQLRDRALPEDVVHDITKATYRDNIEEVDSFELVINNWDAETLAFKYSDSALYDPGKQLQLWMGYHGKEDLRLMINGEITSLRPSFPAAGQPTLTVSGLNILHRFRGKQEPHAYVKKTDTQIAKEVCGRLKVKLETDATAAAAEVPYPYIQQENQYDLNFLIGRARRQGYDLFVKEIGARGRAQDSTLYFGPSVNVKRVTYKLTWGKSLIEFQPNLTTANQVGQVIVRGWDSVHKTKIEGTATRKELKTQGFSSPGGMDAIDQSFSQRQEVIAKHPIASKPEAKKLALETLQRIANDMVRGTASTIGLPDIHAGSVVEMEELGRFSGRYFVTSTTHTIADGGYTTQFECRREELKGA